MCAQLLPCCLPEFLTLTLGPTAHFVHDALCIHCGKWAYVQADVSPMPDVLEVYLVYM